MSDWNSRQERKHTCIHHLQTHDVLVYTHVCMQNTGVLVALDRLHSHTHNLYLGHCEKDS